MKIAIIGAGWYGCHVALQLKEAGHEVEIFERRTDIFTGLSGKFGVRIHKGEHYPRSRATRETCRRDFERFVAAYPELVVEHDSAVYGLGEKDADGGRSKVTLAEFKSVCAESVTCKPIDPTQWGYSGLLGAFNEEEPSSAVGERLRETFRRYLQVAGIRVTCSYSIEEVDVVGDKVVINEQGDNPYDYVVNATSYQALLPTEPLPFPMEVLYQPCLALVYEDKESGDKPFSFIGMDGWFPCLMPYEDGQRELPNGNRKYIVTHGKFTILGSHKTPREAGELLGRLYDDEKFVERKIKPLCEIEMARFFPSFQARFQYSGWKGAVVAKIRSETEFRSAVTFEHKRVIHFVPGKITNIFDVADEVLSLIQNRNILQNGSYRYCEAGVLSRAFSEITQKPFSGRNTCDLQTYEELQRPTGLAMSSALSSVSSACDETLSLSDSASVSDQSVPLSDAADYEVSVSRRRESSLVTFSDRGRRFLIADQPPATVPGLKRSRSLPNFRSL